MPVYEFECSNCGHTWDLLQSFKDEPPKDCPSCKQATAKKLISKSSFHLKGRNWFRDGYGGGRKK